MKKILSQTLLLTVLCSATLSAQSGHSSLQLRLSDNSPVAISVDGTNYNNQGGVLEVNNMDAGQHEVQVFRAPVRHGAKTAALKTFTVNTTDLTPAICVVDAITGEVAISSGSGAGGGNSIPNRRRFGSHSSVELARRNESTSSAKLQVQETTGDGRQGNTQGGNSGGNGSGSHGNGGGNHGGQPGNGTNGNGGGNGGNGNNPGGGTSGGNGENGRNGQSGTGTTTNGGGNNTGGDNGRNGQSGYGNNGGNTNNGGGNGSSGSGGYNNGGNNGGNNGTNNNGNQQGSGYGNSNRGYNNGGNNGNYGDGQRTDGWQGNGYGNNNGNGNYNNDGRGTQDGSYGRNNGGDDRYGNGQWGNRRNDNNGGFDDRGGRRDHGRYDNRDGNDDRNGGGRYEDETEEAELVMLTAKDIAGIKARVLRQKTDAAKSDKLQSEIADRGFTTEQARGMIRLIKTEKVRLEFARWAIDGTSDPEHFSKLATEFKLPASKKEIKKIATDALPG